MPTLTCLRVTDHKTGKNRSNPDLIVGGGGALQPVLYSAGHRAEARASESAEGRLFYATTAGGFVDHTRFRSPTTTGTRACRCSTIIDRAIEAGFLAAAPAERACTWCDFRPVCGPAKKNAPLAKRADRLADLEALRSMR